MREWSERATAWRSAFQMFVFHDERGPSEPVPKELRNDWKARLGWSAMRYEPFFRDILAAPRDESTVTDIATAFFCMSTFPSKHMLAGSAVREVTRLVRIGLRELAQEEKAEEESRTRQEANHYFSAVMRGRQAKAEKHKAETIRSLGKVALGAHPGFVE